MIVERLTRRKPDGTAYPRYMDFAGSDMSYEEAVAKASHDHAEIIIRLAAYEDTNLMPEEIAEHEEMFQAYRHVCGGKSPDEIVDLQAENARLWERLEAAHGGNVCINTRKP